MKASLLYQLGILTAVIPYVISTAIKGGYDKALSVNAVDVVVLGLVFAGFFILYGRLDKRYKVIRRKEV